MQSQVRFNRVRRKFWRRSGSLWCSQVRFNRVPVPEKVSEKVWVGGFGAARSGSTGFWRRFQRLASQHASERFVTIKNVAAVGDTTEAYFFFRQDIGVFEGKIIEAAQVLILITVVVVSFLSWIHSAPKFHG